MTGYTKEAWIARRLREDYSHVRTTADLMTLLEQTLIAHRQGNTPNSTRLTCILALTIDHLWTVPNTPTPLPPQRAAIDPGEAANHPEEAHAA
jgi:hypothetical protein